VSCLPPRSRGGLAQDRRELARDHGRIGFAGAALEPRLRRIQCAEQHQPQQRPVDARRHVDGIDQRAKARLVALAQTPQVARHLRHIVRHHPHDHARKSGIGEQHVQVGGNRGRQPFPWRPRPGDRTVHGAADAAHALLVHRHQQPALGGKVHVDGADRHTHVAGDVADGRRRIAVRGKALRRGSQDTLARLLLDGSRPHTGPG